MGRLATLTGRARRSVQKMGDVDHRIASSRYSRRRRGTRFGRPDRGVLPARARRHDRGRERRRRRTIAGQRAERCSRFKMLDGERPVVGRRQRCRLSFRAEIELIRATLAGQCSLAGGELRSRRDARVRRRRDSRRKPASTRRSGRSSTCSIACAATRTMPARYHFVLDATICARRGGRSAMVAIRRRRIGAIGRSPVGGCTACEQFPASTRERPDQRSIQRRISGESARCRESGVAAGMLAVGVRGGD